MTGDAATAQRLVTGDTVNTAARLEQAAGPNEVLIGELTWRLVRDAVKVEPIEPLELKGKAERVAAYRLLEVAPASRVPRATGASRSWAGTEELAFLAGPFPHARVDERKPTMATVIGDAGVGKSRLIREVVASVADEATVVSGRCLSMATARRSGR